jgi:hypothetical protein
LSLKSGAGCPTVAGMKSSRKLFVIRDSFCVS